MKFNLESEAQHWQSGAMETSPNFIKFAIIYT